jgi:hypothetical protein
MLLSSCEISERKRKREKEIYFFDFVFLFLFLKLVPHRTPSPLAGSGGMASESPPKSDLNAFLTPMEH